MEKRGYFRILIFTVLLVCVLMLLTLPFFSVQNVEISGNSRLSESFILDTLRLNGTVKPNVFLWDKSAAKKRLMNDMYVDGVYIKLDYLKRDVTVQIKERILSGYIEYIGGTYLYIDENGRVLDAKSSFTEPLPMVVGLEFSRYTVGEILDVKNKLSFDLVVTLARLFNKYDFGSEVIRMNVSDPEDIHLFIAQVDVEFGNITDADEKVRTVKEIMENHLNDTGQKGFLNVKDINKPIRFRPLQ